MGPLYLYYQMGIDIYNIKVFHTDLRPFNVHLPKAAYITYKVYMFFFFNSFIYSLGIEPMTFKMLVTSSTVWAIGIQWLCLKSPSIPSFTIPYITNIVLWMSEWKWVSEFWQKKKAPKVLCRIHFDVTLTIHGIH